MLASDSQTRGGGPATAGGRFSFVLSGPVDESHDLAPDGVHETGWGGHAAAPLWVGFVPYEAQRHWERTLDTRRAPAPLERRPFWYRYDAAVRIDHQTGTVSIEADSAAAAKRTADSIQAGWGADGEAYALTVHHVDEPVTERNAHVARVERALEYIRAGDIYEVNLARRLDLTLRGGGLLLLEQLTRFAPSPFGFLLEHPELLVCGASPELAIERIGRSLLTAPMKGTRPRGADRESDERLARELDESEKERAELTMAIDLHRNDLARIAETGTVRTLGEPRVAPGRTVWSRSGAVVALCPPTLSNAELLQAVLPCGSVTGAPKRRAMQIIAELEADRRGLYTGAYGYVGRDGALTMAVAIRTLVFGPARDGERKGAYFTGGGIVADSDPEAEFEETRWKAVHLSELARAAAPKSP